MTSPAPPNFDRVARIYRWAEYLSLGPLLQRTRTHFLPELHGCRNALVLGDGDGRFLARLLQQSPALYVLAVDSSAAMLRLLCARCLAACPAANLRTIQTSALEISSALSPDLIVTHFFLDCLTQPQVNELVSRVAAQAQPGALWLVSDFEVPPSRILRPFAWLYIRSLYVAFRLLTGLRIRALPNPQVALEAAGFVRIARHTRLFGILYTELWRHR